jgi:hypothetical protein
MEKLHIYEVTHMHGGWVSNGYPSETVVARSEKEAKEMALAIHKYWEPHNTHATEFKINGYVIEVYDERTYKRDKNLEKLDIE